MGRAELATELSRIADEAHAARERLAELVRQAAELRAQLEAAARAESTDEQAARKLHSVQ